MKNVSYDQILNVDNPIATENTNIIACMQANHENLIAITKIQKELIECVSSETWKNKRSYLFVLGAYAFLV